MHDLKNFFPLFILLFILLFIPLSLLAANLGVSVTTVLIPKDPPHLKGYHIGFWQHPLDYCLPKAQLYFEENVGHWSISDNQPNASITIYAVSPIVRLFFKGPDTPFSIFFNLGIGPSWLTRTRLETRNLGMHFAFQDQAGFGATFKQLTVMLNAFHYSNGSLAAHNSGITMPLTLTVAWQL
jgi:hypothetical protein